MPGLVLEGINPLRQHIHASFHCLTGLKGLFSAGLNAVLILMIMPALVGMVPDSLI